MSRSKDMAIGPVEYIHIYIYIYIYFFLKGPIATFMKRGYSWPITALLKHDYRLSL